MYPEDLTFLTVQNPSITPNKLAMLGFFEIYIN